MLKIMTPHKTITLFENAELVEQEFVIKKIELKQFIIKNDPKLGPYSVITLHVSTDKGNVEMVYDEGYRGNNVLDSLSEFLRSNMGLSALVLRSIIELRENLSKGS